MRGCARPTVLFVLLAVLVAVSCATVPYTRRSQLMLVSDSTIDNLGAQAYREVLSKERISRDPRAVEVVNRVGERIARAVDQPKYQWKFTVIDNPKQANAFALPGGKVAVYTGLFPVAENSAGLAAVVGHEVGHVLAHHAAERMSRGMLLNFAAGGLGIALGAQNPAVQSAVMQAFGLGAQVGVVLPFNRDQEAEADRIGLILMAKAGYDPHAALDLWRRFEKSAGDSPPEFLSTHPSRGTRERNIAEWMPEAMKYYRPRDVGIMPLPGK